MGMYTELVLKAGIKDGIPDDVEAILQYLFNRTDEPTELPNHEFFKCDRWRFIGSCSSFYHVPFSLSKYEDRYIFSRSDLKNYDGEIGKFISWVMPYIDSYDGVCIGWSWYEEEDSPTLLFYKQGD